MMSCMRVAIKAHSRIIIATGLLPAAGSLGDVSRRLSSQHRLVPAWDRSWAPSMSRVREAARRGDEAPSSIRRSSHQGLRYRPCRTLWTSLYSISGVLLFWGRLTRFPPRRLSGVFVLANVIDSWENHLQGISLRVAI
jgi:hypothetical protein